MRVFILLVIELSCGWIFTAAAQGIFQNLGFESAAFPGAPVDPVYGRYDISNAMPGWTAYVGARRESLILHNNAFLDSAGIGIMDRACDTNMLGGFCRVIEGNSTALLESGYDLNGTGPQDVSLTQTGLIPSDARSVRFKGVIPAGVFHVWLAGQEMPVYPLLDQPGYTLYGADVSPYAGQGAELRFTVGFHSVGWLDSVQFSSTPVPEPAAWVLFLAGAGVAGMIRTRQRLPE
jgi:hypothetical protein